MLPERLSGRCPEFRQGVALDPPGGSSPRIPSPERRMVEASRADLSRLEEKLASAKERQRTLAHRHMRATGKKRVGEDLSRADSSEALLRFEQFENRIERLEAEAELAGPAATVRHAAGESLEARFDRLEADEDVERELARLKAKRQG